MSMDEMAVRYLAGKDGPVDQQHPQASSGKQHGCRGAGTARADDDGIIDRSHVVPPLRRSGPTRKSLLLPSLWWWSFARAFAEGSTAGDRRIDCGRTDGCTHH